MASEQHLLQDLGSQQHPVEGTWGEALQGRKKDPELPQWTDNAPTCCVQGQNLQKIVASRESAEVAGDGAC